MGEVVVGVGVGLGVVIDVEVEVWAKANGIKCVSCVGRDVGNGRIIGTSTLFKRIPDALLILHHST